MGIVEVEAGECGRRERNKSQGRATLVISEGSCTGGFQILEGKAFTKVISQE